MLLFCFALQKWQLFFLYVANKTILENLDLEIFPA